jgi:FtsP/CotA-like multicopper oxidase with cupredoxin domain
VIAPGHFPDLVLSRRKFLGLGAGALATLGLGSAAHSRSIGPYFRQPEVRRSARGFLHTSLRAVEGPAIVQGQVAIARTYEGMCPGPTLVVRPGDFLVIDFVNELAEPTNLHLHGLHVSPLTPGDNPLLHIEPGQRFRYEYTIPRDHPGGTYFYHPHFHGLVTNQVFKGMSGLLIVEGDLDALPGIAGLPERSLVMQRTFVRDGQIPTLFPGGFVGLGDVMVNGVLTPVMLARPGEVQRWRLLNATASSFWTIQVADHDLTLIARDGNTLTTSVTAGSVDIAPAQRRDVLVRGGRPAVYPMTYIDTQTPLGRRPPVVFAYLVVTGVPVDAPAPPTTLLPFVDLRTLPVDHDRAITFQDTGLPFSGTFPARGFVIDGQPFDEHRIDQFARLGATEEWTVHNQDILLAHPFHIHINPYQVTRINEQPYEASSYEDTTPVPAGGSITFRTRLLDFTGTYVYHCHILGHEDSGMMGTIQVS